MDGVAKVWLVGRLTTDPERVETKSGSTIAKFGVAVNRSHKVGDDWQEEVHYFDVVRFGKAADTTIAKLRKGDEVTIEGRLEQSRWEAQDGSKRSKVSVVAERAWSQGFYREGEGQDRGSSRPSRDLGDVDFSNTGEDDIPF